MKRFTIEIPDELNDWLVEQAKKHNRSKNKQIVYFLEKIRALSKTALASQKEDGWIAWSTFVGDE